ncbi:GNAT family N-acetyltransferase [Halalkalibacterium halodurans]|uniref:GNAT family N-acetyltransferase n=1 Tax=Halalkalibacterium halodurans TaxID=86665 RepID=UPI002E2335D8|nr:GNAT family N-acetyltransferase [Halalkalibacterium halodurans]
MEAYQFIKDYKAHDPYRKSFIQLAKRIFNIDFAPWYEQGFWSDNYICYSYVDKHEVIANVSVNKMELIINGAKQKAIQIGTVMTAPEYRRQGLAKQLLQKALDDYDSAYDLYFLAANQEAIPLYETCGFQLIEENCYEIDMAGYTLLDKPLRRADVSPEAMVEVKKGSCPLSTVLSAQGDEHILMFYYTAGFRYFIYQVNKVVHVMFQLEGDVLHLYDIFSPAKVNVEQLVEQITPRATQTVVCHFTPDHSVKQLTAKIDSTSSWMVRTTTKGFPPLARFPKISQA